MMDRSEQAVSGSLIPEMLLGYSLLQLLFSILWLCHEMNKKGMEMIESKFT